MHKCTICDKEWDGIYRCNNDKHFFCSECVKKQDSKDFPDGLNCPIDNEVVVS